MEMEWTDDPFTAEAAREVPIINCEDSEEQFEKIIRISDKWQKHLLPSDDSIAGSRLVSPKTIIEQFENKHYLKGLVFVVLWGKMYLPPAKRKIYKPPKEDILNALEVCAKSLKDTRQIDASWQLLTGYLSWSPVMASKTLHFLSRAVGFEQNPPVPIDNKVILRKVWPCWEEKVSTSGHTPPENWDWKGAKDGGLAGYLRYMTAIRVWAEKKGWTTTQMEATIFAEYYS